VGEKIRKKRLERFRGAKVFCFGCGSSASLTNIVGVLDERFNLV